MLSSRNKTLGILFLIAAAFFAYIYFYEVQYKQKAQETKNQAFKIFSPLKDKVKQITLKNSFGQWQWAKSGENWSFQKPMVTEADAAEVNRVLEDLYEVSFKEKVPHVKPSQLQNFGFFADSPKNTFIEFLAQDKPDGPTTSKTLLIGDNTPVQNKFYAMVFNTKYEGLPTFKDTDVPEVFITDKNIKTQLDKEMKAFRAKNLVSFRQPDVDTVTLVGRDNNSKYLLRRNNTSATETLISHIEWWGDRHFPADSTQVENVLSTLKNLKAQDFIDQEPTPAILQKYGLHLPDLTLTLTDKDKKSMVLAYRKDMQNITEGVVYVKGKNLLYRVKDADIQKLNLASHTLYMKKPFARLRLDSLLGVTFRYRGQDVLDISFDKKEKTWILAAKEKLANTPPVAIKDTKIKAFEETLNQLDIKEYKITPATPNLQSGWNMEVVFKFQNETRSLWYKPMSKDVVFGVPEYGLEMVAEKASLKNKFEPFFTYGYFYDPVKEDVKTEPIASNVSSSSTSEKKGAYKPMTKPLSDKIERPSKDWAKHLKSPEAILEVEGKGTVKIKLEVQKAPLTVSNFVNLATHKFYDGLTFHRVIKDFMAQGGDPNGTGTGGPGYKFEDETSNGLAHDRGVISMANSGPNTNGSQFFITFQPQPHLNGKHTVFGRVVEGLSVLDSIQQGDKIKSVKIVDPN